MRRACLTATLPHTLLLQHTHTELDKVRAKLLDAACVDLGYGLMQHALEVVRR
jgi:hypothetical protein